MVGLNGKPERVIHWMIFIAKNKQYDFDYNRIRVRVFPLEICPEDDNKVS